MTDHRKPYEKPTLTPIPYDSAADTLRHSRRVGELIGAVVGELVRRMTSHDLSKLGSIEKEAFDRMSPKLKTLTYGSDEYKASLKELGPALQHHYQVNRHHPEHDPRGIAGMTLVDLVEMLCDWKAAGERHADGGDLRRSLDHNAIRFSMADDLVEILNNTAREFGWLE